MGGALPLHFAMAIYCWQEYNANRVYFNECNVKISRSLDSYDVILMLVAHIVCIVFIIISYILKNISKEEWKFVNQSLKHYKMFIYMVCILNVQDKIYAMPNFSSEHDGDGKDDYYFILYHC
jgi:hypothetical protein